MLRNLSPLAEQRGKDSPWVSISSVLFNLEKLLHRVRQHGTTDKHLVLI